MVLSKGIDHVTFDCTLIEPFPTFGRFLIDLAQPMRRSYSLQADFRLSLPNSDIYGASEVVEMKKQQVLGKDLLTRTFMVFDPSNFT